MKSKSFLDLFVDQLQDAYSAESQLTKALPKLIKSAHTPTLRTGLEKHLEETKHQKSRLEEICKELNVKPTGNDCEAMQGLIEEGTEIMEMDLEPEVRDAGLIGAAQKVEHYEIALYGTLCAFAKQLGYLEIAAILQETLDEEKKADQTLSRVATTLVNELAVNA